MEGYKSLKEGTRVTFDIADGPKGLTAVNIQAETPPTANPAPDHI
jgi:CspA family cold shock protein